MEQQSGISWTPIGGQSGAAATIASVGGGVAVITGLTGITSASALHLLTLTGCANPANNGTYQIVAAPNATTVWIANPSAVFPDANSGSIGWVESTLALSFPATIGIPDDGDEWDAAEFQPGYEGLAQRTALLEYRRKLTTQNLYLASATWIAPPGCNWVIVEGCGGGGGGEQGCVGSNSTTQFSAQGGGGAGAPYERVVVPVVPGVKYTLTIGAGGVGGSGGGGAGADGGSTIFTDGVGINVQFLGGRGAGIGIDVVASGFGDLAVTVGGGGVGVQVAPGGEGVASSEVRPWPFADVIDNTMHYFPASVAGTQIDSRRYGSRASGSGGAAIAAQNIRSTTITAFPQGASLAGMPSEVQIGGSFAGGAAGNIGADASGPHFGGPGGGGGGGGPFGSGGAGGAGGVAHSSGTGGAGSAGGNAGSNSGGGGGGGGTGGGAPTGGAGGAGGNGGSGILLLSFLQDFTFNSGVVTP